MNLLQGLHGSLDLVLVERLPVPLLHGPGVAHARGVRQQEDVLLTYAPKAEKRT